MSKEEKMLVLQMVADGQITPEQGVELLNALEPGKAHGLSYGISQGISEGLSRGLSFETDIGDVGRQKVEEASVRVEDIAGGVAGNIGKVLSQIFGGTSFGGSRFEFTEEIRGEFPEDGELEVGVWTSNGRIHVETWDEPGYLLTVIKKIRAQDEDEARQVLENCYEFSQERLSLKVKATDKHGLDFRGLSVGFSLKVPASRKASLTLKSANGRVTADKLNGSSCLMGTANGRVVASGCGFDKVRLSTANGRIEYEGTAGELDASTANGSVNAELKGAGDWRFSSANGRISINVSKDANAAYELDLSARAGGITVEGMDDAEVAEDVAVGRHRRRYKARSRGFENAGVKGRIRATTGNGRIRVLF